jgi:hypothetical protein
MAQNILNLRFNLRNPKATKPTPVNLVIRYNNQKYTYPTSENILPTNWQGDKTKKKGYQRAKQTPGFLEWPEFNARLNNIENTVDNIFRRYKNDNNDEIPKWSKFKEL